MTDFSRIISDTMALTSGVRQLQIAPEVSTEANPVLGQAMEIQQRVIGNERITPYGTYCGTYSMYDRMARCPTLAFVRSTVTAPLMQLGYVVEADDGVPESIAQRLDPMVRDVFPSIVQKCTLALDYGWIGMEKKWEMSGNEWRVVDVIDLPVYRTSVLIDKYLRFAGLEYRFEDEGIATASEERVKSVRIPLANSFILTHQMRFGNYYGMSRFENCLSPEPRFPGAYDLWLRSMQNAAAAVRKAGGSVVIVYYPKGKVKDRNGNFLTNYQQAVTIAQAVSEGRPIVVENLSGVNIDKLAADKDLVKTGMWSVEVKDLGQSADSVSGVIEAALYADKMLCRAWLRPERAVLEAANAGSRADSEVHGDVAMLDSESVLSEIMAAVNKHLVNDLVRLNFGPEYIGKIRLQPVPIVSHKTAQALSVYRTILQSPEMARLDALPRTDINAIMDMAGIPKTTDGAVEPIELQPSKPAPAEVTA